MKFKSNLFLTITIILAFVLTSCGSSNNSIIATAVALTVQAHDTQSAPVAETALPLATGLSLATNLPLADTTAAVGRHSHATCNNTASRIYWRYKILHSNCHLHQ